MPIDCKVRKISLTHRLCCSWNFKVQFHLNFRVNLEHSQSNGFGISSNHHALTVTVSSSLKDPTFYLRFFISIITNKIQSFIVNCLSIAILAAFCWIIYTSWALASVNQRRLRPAGLHPWTSQTGEINIDHSTKLCPCKAIYSTPCG